MDMKSSPLSVLTAEARELKQRGAPPLHDTDAKLVRIGRRTDDEAAAKNMMKD